MIDLDQLKTFVIAAELSNFTHAAKRLHLSQSAVSQQVRELEHKLECPLFVRGARRVGLTPAGERLLPLARKLLADAKATAEAVRAIGIGVSGVVRVAASPLVAGSLLVPAVGAFTRTHPGIRVCIDVFPADGVADRLHDAGYDAAIAEGQPPYGRHGEVVLLRREPMRAVCAPSRWPLGGGDAAEALAEVPIIGWPDDSVGGAVVRAGLAASGVDLEGLTRALVVADPLVQVSAAVNGVGLAIVPHLAAAADLEAGRLRTWVIPGFSAAIDIWSVATSNQGATAFVAWLARQGGAAIRTG